MGAVNLIFPHQLFEDSPLLYNDLPFVLVEEFLFFRQYKFHQQKIAYHRASMRFYADYLRSLGKELIYVESQELHSDCRQLIPYLKEKGVGDLYYLDSCDDWLERRLKKACDALGIKQIRYEMPMFLNSESDINTYFKDKKRFFQTDFYIAQRKKRRLLLQETGKPLGDKWSFDSDNRLKYPKGKNLPPVLGPDLDAYYEEALMYVQKHFSEHYGQVSKEPLFPYRFDSAKLWLQQFLEQRLWEFGHYEDAILEKASFLHHSVLTPMLNCGLLTPQQVLDATLDYAAQHPDLPMNSLEGFIRQIVGWREYIRAVYLLKGRRERSLNYWGFRRKIPASFWTGDTGIAPIDAIIKKVLKTGYCHHIERLMVLGNFMLLCEFDPDEVYRWFMELFIDAYDWVMVPNVYGMSQFADGGIMSTKPYISGSNYLLKMSDFKKGPWQEIWDALFWRFMHEQRSFFLQNPRLGMLVHSFDKMDSDKQKALLQKAANYLASLDAAVL